MTPDAAPLSPASAWLEVPDGGTYPLNRDTYIGRVAGSEIVVPDHRISRRHAVVQCQHDRYSIVDLGSTNGTFVNDTRIFRPTELCDADIIAIGGQHFVFCQPVRPDDTAADAVAGTAVIVGRTACWMLVCSVVEPGSASALAWIGQVEAAMRKSGAGVKRWRGASLLVHWRVELVAPAAIRGLILELAAAPMPPEVRVALHFGCVRVGAGAGPAEENLLGAAVTFTHQLAAAAGDMRERILLSDEAAKSLDLTQAGTRREACAVAGAPGLHRLFVLPLG